MGLCRSLVQGVVVTVTLVSTVWSQVAVVAPGSRELKRAAHRLRVTPERLQNMRVALREATEVARRIDPATSVMIGPIAHGWVQFNRPEAKPNLEELYRDLRMAAGNGEDARGYQSATQGAQAPASAYAQIDFDPDKLQLTFSSTRPLPRTPSVAQVGNDMTGRPTGATRVAGPLASLGPKTTVKVDPRAMS